MHARSIFFNNSVRKKKIKPKFDRQLNSSSTENVNFNRNTYRCKMYDDLMPTRRPQSAKCRDSDMSFKSES